MESRKESYEEVADKQINYMWEEYELTYSHALELRNENLTDLAMMKKEVQTLKSEIKALGPVNVNAIEDFKNLSERYDFLKGQHDDLVEAEATLVKIIDELDEAMRRQFTEQFARIAKEFDLVFKELFGGGKGTLELMEDEDILEAGIRIGRATGQETAEYDAAFRWGKGTDGNLVVICYSEPETITVLSAG